MAGLRRVALVGTGLIGGSIGLGLRRAGVEVWGVDQDRDRADEARARGALDGVASGVAEAVEGADLTIVAVPVGRGADVVVEALDAGSPLVTDVGSVKAPVVGDVEARP